MAVNHVSQHERLKMSFMYQGNRHKALPSAHHLALAIVFYFFLLTSELLC